MPKRVFLLCFVSSLIGFAQSGPPPSTPLTYFLGRGWPGAAPGAVAAGPGGDIWVGGETNGNSFPVVNAFQPEHSPGYCGRFGGCSDLFLSRLRADGQGAVFSTYLGGPSGEWLADIAVDGESNAYLVGSTSSASFPFSSPLPDDPPSGYWPFVVKISPAGEIVYAVALPSVLIPAAVAVDRQGSVYIGGTSFGEVEQVGGLGLEPGEADLLRSDDGGQSWQFRNRGLTNGGFSGDGTELVAARSGDGVRLYAVGAQSLDAESLYRSDDRGALWQRLSPPEGLQHPVFTDLAVDLSQPDRAFVARGCGLHGSSDGGETWGPLASHEIQGLCISRVVVAQSQPQTLYASGYFNKGALGLIAWVGRSDDGGQSWSDVPLPQGENLITIEDLAVDPTDASIVYASCQTTGGFPLFRTDNAGESWRRIFENSTRVPLIDAAEPRTLFLVTRSFNPEGRLVYRSFDRGETWLSSVVPEPPGSDGGWLLNLALGAEALYLTTNEGFLFLSADRGQTWSRTPGPPVPVHQIAADPAQPATVYALGNSHLEQGFVLKLNADGSGTEYLTLLGGSGEDRVQSLALDDAGRVYATGITASPDFPLTSQLTLNRPGFDIDAFLVILNPAGARIEFSTWVGGSGHETDSKVALGKDGAVVLTGSTSSRDFPLENPVTAEPGRLQSHWVAGVNPEEKRIAFAGYLGANDTARPGLALTADPDGSTYVGGTSGSIDENGFATESAFLMRLDAAGNVANLDAVAAEALAVHSPGRIVTAAVGASGILNVGPRINDTPAVAISIRDYNAAEPDGPSLQAFVNAADQRAHPLTPGTVVSLYGANLGPATPVAAVPVNNRYPTEVAGVRVMIGDRPAPLLYVSEGQINAVTPGNLGEHPLVAIRVERGGAKSNVLSITTDSASPAIFSMDSGLGPDALAINADGTLNSPANPAPRGSIVTVFATGVGGFSPPLADGEVAPLEPPFPTVADAAGIEFEFGPTQVTYSGAAPGVVAGVAQFNLTVPTDGPDGDRYIYVKTTTGSTSASFRIAVGP